MLFHTTPLPPAHTISTHDALIVPARVGGALIASKALRYPLALSSDGYRITLTTEYETQHTSLVEWQRLRQLVVEYLGGALHALKREHPDLYQRRQLVGGLVGDQLWTAWKNLRALADPEALRLQQVLFGRTLQVPACACSPTLYHTPLLVQDLLRYRSACALAVGQPENMHTDWRRWYASGERPSRALNRMLDAMPAVPVTPCLRLRDLVASGRLRRPLVDRLEYLCAVLAWELAPDDHPNIDLLLHAQRADIMHAMGTCAPLVERPLSFRRTTDMHAMLTVLLDYPERHAGTISGLAKKSVRWHRRDAQAAGERTAQSLGSATAVLVPPIPLPAAAGMTFLATVGAIVAEGARMGHCVAAYAAQAARGECYLFHAAHAGHHATVEVTRAGTVRQAQGPPGDRENTACQWARAQLIAWGAQFPSLYCRVCNERQPLCACVQCTYAMLATDLLAYAWALSVGAALVKTPMLPVNPDAVAPPPDDLHLAWRYDCTTLLLAGARACATSADTAWHAADAAYTADQRARAARVRRAPRQPTYTPRPNVVGHAAREADATVVLARYEQRLSVYRARRDNTMPMSDALPPPQRQLTTEWDDDVPF